jgi:hypothetical protein
MSTLHANSLMTPKEKSQDGSLHILDSFKLSMEAPHLFKKGVQKRRKKKMIFLYYLVFYFIILYIITSIRLLNSESYTKIQKIIQLSIVWLIPAIGVIIVALFLNQEPIKLKKSSFLKKLFLSLFFIKTDKRRNISGYPNSNVNYTDGEYYDNCSSGNCGGGGD